MEQGLNENKDLGDEQKHLYKLEFPNQNVTRSPEFKKWYSKTFLYIKSENSRIAKLSNSLDDHHLLAISLCNKCNCYVICSSAGGHCAYRCSLCNTSFCIGCLKEQRRESDYIGDDTICIKGFLKGLYLRTIFKRSELVGFNRLFQIIHIILCLFLPFISCICFFYLGIIFSS